MSSSEKEGIHPENYYDYVLNERSLFLRNANATDKFDEVFNSITIFRSVLTVLLRAGFLLVQIGSVPVGNVNLILLQNIIDFCAVTLVSILVGFVIAFNGDIAGLVGKGIWIGDPAANVDEAVVAWSAAITASAICTCGIVGRTHTVGYLITAILISGIVQPFFIHWAWTPRGWMADNNLTGKIVSFKDYAGGGIIHVIGGLSGFLGCMTLGRRIIRLRDIDDSSLPSDSPGITFAGYFLIFLGLQGLSLPIPDRQVSNNVTSLMLNNLLAASSSCLFIVALHFALSREAFNYWTVTRCIQGAISGVVTVAAGLDVYSPLVTIGVSTSSGIIFYLVSRRVYRSALEDYCNVVSTHFASALFGIFLAPLCGGGRPKGTNDAVNHAMVLDVAWQVICILTILLAVTLAIGPFFLLLELCGYLRNRSEFINHLRATTAMERGPPRSFMQRLFFPDIESLYLQPGSVTKTSQGPQIMSPRLWRYQQEITRLERQVAGGKQLGGNKIAEILQDDDHEVEEIEDVKSPEIIQRLKKPRQIYTIRNASSVFEHFDTGGTGESIEKKPAVLELRDGLWESEKKDAIKSTRNLEKFAFSQKFRSFDRIGSIADERRSGCNDLKKFYTVLHRTRKFVSLHSEELNTVLDPKQVVRPSDFTVKVLLEPRRRTYASSDSEEETEVGRTVADWQENLDRTV